MRRTSPRDRGERGKLGDAFGGEGRDDEVLVAERPHGTYTRHLFLGDTRDSDNVRAT